MRTGAWRKRVCDAGQKFVRLQTHEGVPAARAAGVVMSWCDERICLHLPELYEVTPGTEASPEIRRRRVIVMLRLEDDGNFAVYIQKVRQFGVDEEWCQVHHKALMRLGGAICPAKSTNFSCTAAPLAADCHQAAGGAAFEMEIVMDDNCPDCDGTGFGNMNEACRDEPCKTCNGTGKYHTRSVGGAAESIGNCPTCNGTGKVFDDTVPEPQTTMATHKPCPDCVGKVPAIEITDFPMYSAHCANPDNCPVCQTGGAAVNKMAKQVAEHYGSNEAHINDGAPVTTGAGDNTL